MEVYNLPSPLPVSENSPVITLSCVSNVFIRQLHYKKIGDYNEPHVHPHDHLTLLASGSVVVIVEGQKTSYTAPAMIFISKGQLHYFRATADNTVCYCVHALRTGSRVEDILDPESIPAGTKGMDVAKLVVETEKIYKMSGKVL